MILSIVIVILLLAAIHRGYRRGLIKELLYTVGTLFVFLLGLFYDSKLGDALLTLTKQGDPSDPFAHFVAQTIAFWLIMFVGHLIIRWLGRLSRAVTWIPVIKQANGLAGAIIAVVIMYLGIFLALSILNVIEPSWFVSQYTSSPVAEFMIEKTPIVSQNVINWLFQTKTQSFTALL
ncbi:CvpA family protein [Lapidilactobacillus mulanensis]|uniref:CvpA family protein n=1 Tax=Lapidilactobacillus mulanensis TaxID=2485999 RepID=A0ABW4DN76_9LACO|nr:CvpA family protein [Lapidilactobacillus mulanensis]